MAPTKLAGSSSVPVLPAARGTNGPPAGARTGSGKHRPPPSTPGEAITFLENENSTLRLEVMREKQRFSQAFIKDFKSPARRRLEPMKKLSAQFHRRFGDLNSSSPGYHQALLHVLLLETSCFRYWGQGTWTDYAQTIFARGEALIGLDAAA